MEFTIKKFGELDFTEENYRRGRGKEKIKADKSTCHTEDKDDFEYEWLAEITFKDPKLDGNGFATDRMALPKIIENVMFAKKTIPSCEQMMIEIAAIIKKEIHNSNRVTRINVKFRAQRYSYPKSFFPFEYTTNYQARG